MNMAQEMMDVNFFGTLRLIKAVLPSMKARQSGHIINCSSEAGLLLVYHSRKRTQHQSLLLRDSVRAWLQCCTSSISGE